MRDCVRGRVQLVPTHTLLDWMCRADNDGVTAPSSER